MTGVQTCALPISTDIAASWTELEQAINFLKGLPVKNVPPTVAENKKGG